MNKKNFTKKILSIALIGATVSMLAGCDWGSKIKHNHLVDEREWEIIREADCYQTGLRKGKCLIYGEIVEEIIPMRAHVFSDSHYINGHLVYSCYYCGAKEDDFDYPQDSEDSSEDWPYESSSEEESSEEYSSEEYSSEEYSSEESSVEESSENSSVEESSEDSSAEEENTDFEFTLSEDGSYYILTEFLNDSKTSVVIPNTYNGKAVKAIGEEAFADCSDLTYVELPYSITEIGEGAFQYCTSLTSVALPQNLKTIASRAFYSCEGLTSVTIPGSVSVIGSEAFASCFVLVTVNLNNGLTVISDMAFEACESLKSIQLPYTVTTIMDSAFSSCVQLSSMNISSDSNLQTIGYHAFYGCEALTSFTIPRYVEEIDGNIFAGCTSLESISVAYNNSEYTSNSGILYTNSGTALQIYPAGKTSSSYSASGITSILSEAFHDATNLRRIEIGSSVTSIEISCFTNCKITEIDVSTSNSKYQDIAGNLYNKSGDVLLYYAGGKTDVTFSVPSNVRTIGSRAFYGNKNLQTVILPTSLTKIEKNAFANCKNLETIQLNGNLSVIEEKAFYHCAALRSIVIPSSVSQIGENAFGSCNNLSYVVFAGIVGNVDKKAFKGSDDLKTIYYYGTSESFNASSADSLRVAVASMQVYYYSETQPEEEGNYWHYVSGIPQIWS